MTTLNQNNHKSETIVVVIKGLWHTPNVPWILIGIFFLRMSWFMVWPFLSIFLFRVYGFNPIKIGGILGGVALVGAVSSVYGGHFSDRYGRKTLVVACSLLTGFAFVFLALSHSLWFFCGSVLLIAIGNATTDSTCTALLGDSIRKYEYRAIAFQLRYFMINTGCALGVILGALLGGSVRMELFFLPAIMYFGYSLIMWLKLPPQEEKNQLRCKHPHFIKSLKQIISNRAFLLTLIAGTVACYLFANFDSTLIIYLTTSNLSNLGTTITTLVGVNAMVVSLAAIPVMRLTIRVKNQKRILIGFIFFSVANLLFAITQPENIILLIVATCFLSLGEIVVFPAINVEVDRLTPKNMRGLFFGISNLSVIGYAAAPLFGGVLLEILGGQILYGVLTIISIFLLLVLFFSYRIEDAAQDNQFGGV